MRDLMVRWGTKLRLVEARRIQVALWIALILWTIALTLTRLDAFQIGAYHDDADYLVLARSLAYTGHYGLMNRPGTQPGPAPFPCGFPLVLAPFTRLVSVPQAIMIPSLVATLAVASILFWGWPTLSSRSRWWGLAVSGLYLLAPLTVEHARMVMSEAVFTLFLLAAIWLIERIARGGQPLWVALAAGALLAMVPITRTVGLLLWPVAIAYLVVRCGRRVGRELGRLLVGGLLCIGLIVGLVRVPVSGLFPVRYLTEPNAALLTALRLKISAADPAPLMPTEYLTQDQVGGQQVDNGQVVATYARRAAFHIHRDLRRLVLPTGGGTREQVLANRLGMPALPRIIGLLSFALVVLGYVLWLREEGINLLSLFVPLYAVALLFWNWDSPRLLYPVQPPLEFALLLGVEAVLFGLCSRVHTICLRRYQHAAMAALIVMLALVSAYNSLNIDDSSYHVGDLRARTAWLRANAPASAVLMTEAPQIDYLYSERRTVPFPAHSTTATELAEALRQTGTDYVLLAPEIRWSDVYSPAYSPKALVLLDLIKELEAQHEIALVYSSAGLQRVYSVNQ